MGGRTGRVLGMAAHMRPPAVMGLAGALPSSGRPGIHKTSGEAHPGIHKQPRLSLATTIPPNNAIVRREARNYATRSTHAPACARPAARRAQEVLSCKSDGPTMSSAPTVTRKSAAEEQASAAAHQQSW